MQRYFQNIEKTIKVGTKYIFFSWALIFIIAIAHFIFTAVTPSVLRIYSIFIFLMLIAFAVIIFLTRKINITFARIYSVIDESEKNKELLTKLFSNSPEPIILYDKKGKIIRANTSAIQLLALSKEELLSKNVTDLFNESEDLLRKTSEYFSLKGKETFVFTKDKGSKRVLAKAQKIELEEDEEFYQLVFIDITERYEMRNMLLEYNKLNSISAEIAHFGGCKFLPDEDKIIITQETGELIGLPQKEKITFADWLNLIAEEDRHGLELRLETLEKNHDRFVLDYQLKNRENRKFIRQICELEINEEGEKIIWGAVFDITEIQKQKELLLNSEKKYRSIVELAPVGLTVLDITDSYEILKKMFLGGGFTKEKLSNLTLDEIKSLLSNFKIIETNKLNSGSLGQEEFIAFEFQNIEINEPTEKIADIIYKVLTTDEIIRTNLKIKSLLTGSTAIMDVKIRKHFSEGKVILFVASQDVTELVSIKNKLNTTNKLLYNFLDTIPFIVVSLNRNGEVIFINKKGTEIIGENRKEVLGKNWFENYLDPKAAQKFRKWFTSTLEKGTMKFSENVNRIKTKNGTSLIYWYNELVFDENGQAIGTLSLGVDITDEKRKKEELNKSHKELILLKHELEAQNRKLRIARNQLAESEKQLKQELIDKDKLFSLIAHDVRSPFTGLLSGLQFVTEMYDMLSENEKKELIQNAFHASKRIYNLLEELLEWSRLRLGKFKITPEVTNLKELVNSVLELFENDSKRKNIELINEVAENECLFIDKQFIHGILRNLISNSLKFTPDNGSIIVKSINHKNGFYEIDITDTGVGVPEEIIKKFSGEELQNINPTEGTKKEKGFGLGLMLVKELVEKINGHIYIENRKEGGTKVMVFIPRDKVVDCNKN